MAMNKAPTLPPNEGGASFGGFSHETESELRQETHNLERLFAPLVKDSKGPHSEEIKSSVSGQIEKVKALLKKSQEEGGAGPEKQVKLGQNARKTIENATQALHRGERSF